MADPPGRPEAGSGATRRCRAHSSPARSPRPPASRPRGTRAVGGARHTTSRDRAAISHHYDLSNEFYEFLLDPSMAYSFAYWAREDSEYGLAEAQRDKLGVICRKLRLRPGARLLDIGCGWGVLALYVAEHHKVQVTAVSLARLQSDAVLARVRERGLEDLVGVQMRHYPDI